MGRMFKCEDGTMFPISEVLSVQEATYRDYGGNVVDPEAVFTDEEAMKLAYAHAKVSPDDYEEGWIAKTFRHLCVKLKKGDVRKSDQKVKEGNQRAYKKAVEFQRRLCFPGPTDPVRDGMVMKQWEVRIRRKRDVIIISNADYKKLCSMMGK